MFTENESSPVPQEDSNHHRTEELAHGVGKEIAAVDAVESATRGVGSSGKAVAQFLLGVKSLDHAQSAKGLLYLREQVGSLLLSQSGCALQRPTDTSDKKTYQREQKEHKHSQLPREEKERSQVDDNHQRVLEDDVQRGHNRCLHLVDIVGHTRHNIPLLLFGEEAYGKRNHFVVEHNTQVAQHARANGHHIEVSQPRSQAFKESGQHQKQS